MIFQGAEIVVMIFGIKCFHCKCQLPEEHNSSNAVLATFERGNKNPNSNTVFICTLDSYTPKRRLEPIFKEVDSLEHIDVCTLSIIFVVGWN